MDGRVLPRADRRVSWQSVTAGFVLNAGMFLILVAVSYPLATGVVVAAGIGLYVLGGVVRRSDYERTLLVCRDGFCLRLQLCVG